MFKKRVAIMLVVCLLVSLVTVTGVMKSKATDATVTIDFSTYNLESGKPITTVSSGEVILTFDKASGSSTPTYYSTDSTARIYQNNTLTVKVGEESTITKIEFVATQYGKLKTDTGS